MTGRVRIGWLTLALAAGCEMRPPAQQVGVEAPSGPLRPAVKAAADDPARLDGAGQTKFILSQLRFLQLRLQVPQMVSGVKWMTVQIYTPQGSLYGTRHVPFSTDESVKEVESVDGVPHPIEVMHPKAIPGGYGLDAQLLVGGTNMVRRPNPGTWKITMEVDGEPATRAETSLELGGEL